MRKHHDLFIIGTHCIVFAILVGLGVNLGFIVDTWFQPVFPDQPLLTLIIAIVSGAFFGVGSYGLFIKSERVFHSVRNLASRTEFWIRMCALVMLNLLFIGADIAGLFYRAQFLNQRGVGYLLYIGIVLAVFPALVSLVLHPLQNRSLEEVEDEMFDTFSRAHVRDVYSELEALPLHMRHQAFISGEDGMVDVLEDAVTAKQDQRPVQAPKARPLTRLLSNPKQRPFTKALSPDQANRQSES